MLGIYVRLSKEDETSNSIENQLREGRQFAQSNGYKKFEVYNEGQGISGGNEIKDRPELDRLMKDIASKKLGAVWFRHQNRLERNSLTFHLFSDLAKQMKINVFFGDKKADLTDPSQFLQASIMTAVNAFEIEKQRSQIKRTLLDNAKEGKATGGKHIPYGYTTDENKYLVIDPKTAKVVELIFKRCLEGIGGGKIAKELNEIGIPTKNGALVWKQPTVHSIIKNPAYKGQKRFRDKHYPIPPILDKEIWNKAQKQLKLNVSFKGKRVEHKYLLKHLTFCGKCGRPMHVMNYDKIIRYYRCSSARSGDNCHNPYFRIDALENLIWGLFEFNTLYEAVETHLTGEGNEGKLKELTAEKILLKDKLLRVGAKLQTTIDLVVEGLVEKDEIDKTRKKVKGEQETLERKIENLEEQIVVISDQDKLKKHVRKDLDKFKTGMKKVMEILFESSGKDLTKLKGRGLENFIETFVETTDKADILEKIPFNEKRVLIKKYIKSVEVKGIENGFLIGIKFALPLPDSLIFVSKNYDVVIDSKTESYLNFDLLNKNEDYQDSGKKAIAKLIMRNL